jgi:hypothetical protein
VKTFKPFNPSNPQPTHPSTRNKKHETTNNEHSDVPMSCGRSKVSPAPTLKRPPGPSSVKNDTPSQKQKPFNLSTIQPFLFSTCSSLNTEQQTQNNKHKTTNTKQQTTNNKHKTINTKQQTQNNKHKTTNTKQQTQNNKHETTNN